MSGDAGVVVGTGQSVQVHARGRIVATAVRTGRGWSFLVGRHRYEAVSLDGVLVLLGRLPDHHARERRR